MDRTTWLFATTEANRCTKTPWTTNLKRRARRREFPRPGGTLCAAILLPNQPALGCPTGPAEDARPQQRGNDHPLHRRGFGSTAPIHRTDRARRSEEHTSELQSLRHLVCRLLLEKKNKKPTHIQGKTRLFDRLRQGLTACRF